MVIIGQNEIKRFVHDNKDIFALIHNGRIIWGNWIVITPNELDYMFVGDEKNYSVMSVGTWAIEELFASDASRSLLENSIN